MQNWKDSIKNLINCFLAYSIPIPQNITEIHWKPLAILCGQTGKQTGVKIIRTTYNNREIQH